jgi:hypothetical protein
MNAAFMLLDLHERGIHVVSTGGAGTTQQVSVVTTVWRGRVGTKSDGQSPRCPPKIEQPTRHSVLTTTMPYFVGCAG